MAGIGDAAERQHGAAYSPPSSEPPKDRLAALLILPLTFVLVALVLVFFVIWRPTVVAGPSMLPTLRPDDRLLSTRGYGMPRRGDIVIFDVIESGARTQLVKRVVGVPGDLVLTVGDLAWVNGQPESVPHLLRAGPDTTVQATVTVPPGRLFVMGDNRPASLDSRDFGPVLLTSVKGRAVAIFSPVDRIRRLPRPAAR